MEGDSMGGLKFSPCHIYLIPDFSFSCAASNPFSCRSALPSILPAISFSLLSGWNLADIPAILSYLVAVFSPSTHITGQYSLDYGRSCATLPMN
jgi:hypothetical protein